MKLKSLNKICLVVVLLLANFLSFAQNIKFKRFSIDEGLSQASVKSIFQDSQGFIWVGTQDGLNRYDGFHIKVFKTEQNNKASLPSNDINCLFEDKDGMIYIGTNDQGLSVYNKFTEQFTNYTAGSGKNNLSNNSVRSILDLNGNELLIATEDGLNLFNKSSKSFNKITVSGNILATDLKYIYRDSKNQIWIASFEHGLFQFNTDIKSLIHFPIPESLNNIEDTKNHMRCLIEVNESLWCGTDDGLLAFNLKNRVFSTPTAFEKEAKYSKRIVSFALDKNINNLWIGTWEGLINYNVKNSTYSIYKNNELDQSSLSNNKTSCLLADNQKNIWIGTTDKGINIYFPTSIKFPLFNKNNGLLNDYVYSIIQTNDKNIFVGTEDGLYSFNPKDIKFIDYSSVLKKYNAKTVLSLCEDKDKNIWIGTYGQGVIIFNPKTKQTKKLLGESYAYGTVTKIIQDKNGVIWLALYGGGVCAINPNTFSIKNYTTKEGLPSDKVYSIYENKSDNTLWISTQGGGFCILNFILSSDKPMITVFKHNENKNSISSNIVNNIYKDNDGVFWIATTNGLNRFDYSKKQFSGYFERDGLSNSYIYDVLPDNKGNLWLPTNSGLTRFNPNFKNDNGSAFKNYGTKDGIQAREFNQGASFLCKDGKILVGGIAGLNYFNPNDIKENTITPKSYIYDFNRQGKGVITDSNIIFKKFIELSYKENYFTLEFVTLDYVSPEKNKFMFMLEGYDKNWSAPTNVRYASYTELPGGTYIFKVKATNSDGVWNNVPQQFTIKVIPPWWRTTWFYIIAFVLGTASVFGFISYRTNAVKKENKILENKVNERTHELADKNRDITSSIEYAKRIQEAILPAQELIFSKLKKAFILYKPKDIVSGDFYWFGEKDNYKIIATVDCTGHGVPGAFMSMIGHNLLNQIISEKDTFDPGLILQELHKGIQSALKQGQNQVHTNDGMDVSMIAINTETRNCFWAGAFRSLVIIDNNNNLEKIEGNKYPVGGSQINSQRVFTTHVRTLKENDTVYMFTDGYADQFGGEKGKKFMVKRFHEILLGIHKLEISAQKNELEDQFNNWKGAYEQVDDVLVIGIKM
jgi:ligand-binding sensor domain-containing protein/serine phosphatase RsbU (regulator of sigma subunit)